MRVLTVFSIVAFLLCGAANGVEETRSYFVPPVSAKILADELNPLDQERLNVWLEQAVYAIQFDDYAGATEALSAARSAKDGFFEVGAPVVADLASSELFGAPVDDEGCALYLCRISSVDAAALRLVVDLSGLKPDEEVWVVDPHGPRAFGPYTGQDAVPGGLALATTGGEEVLLAVRSPHAAMPELVLEGLSHLYMDAAGLAAKELDCNINIACAEETAAYDMAAGVCLVLFVNDDFIAGGGTGTLINHPSTNQPVILTANHVVSARSNLSSVELLWDFRSTACDSNDSPPLGAAFSTLPRSSATAIAQTSSSLDVTLLNINAVPNGIYGRFYFGWTLRAPLVGEPIFGIHHPDLAHMRISTGHIQAVDLYAPVETGFLHQTKVGWSNGVTEGGSSGSALIFDDANLQICGTLSGGPMHVCGEGPDRNYDYYASWRDFYQDCVVGEEEEEEEDEVPPGCVGAQIRDRDAIRWPGADALVLAGALIVMIVLARLLSRGRHR